MWVRWLATVRSPRNSAAATSRFVRPSATRAATRRSAAVSPSSRVRPPMLPELGARLLDPGRPPRAARSRRAPPRSRRGRRASAARAGGRRRARAARGPGRRDRRRPRARATACSRSDAACSTSPRAAATRPRQRVTCASTHSRPSRAASASQTSRTRTASSIRPSSSSSLDVVGASTSGRSARPSRAPRPAGRPCRATRAPSAASPLQSATSPRTARCCGGWSAELLLGQLERSLRVLARELELAAMDGDRRRSEGGPAAPRARTGSRCRARGRRARPRAPSARPRTRPRRGPRARGRSAARRARATPRCSRSSSARASSLLEAGASVFTTASVASCTSCSPPTRGREVVRPRREIAAAPPRRRRTSRGSPAPRGRAPGARRRRARRRARAPRGRARAPP